MDVAGDEYNRLRWQCRRGMLELDVMLGAFLENAWPNMDDRGRRSFRRLLEYPDQKLQGWLCDGMSPDREVADIVKAIRATNRY